jgi:hypothetical protein
MSSRYGQRVHGEVAGEFCRFAVIRRCLTGIELDSQDAEPDLENIELLAARIRTTLSEHLEAVYLKSHGVGNERTKVSCAD